MCFYRHYYLNVMVNNGKSFLVWKKITAAQKELEISDEFGKQLFPVIKLFGGFQQPTENTYTHLSFYHCDKISARKKNACNLKRSLEVAIFNIQKATTVIWLTSALVIQDQFLTETLTAFQGGKRRGLVLFCFLMFPETEHVADESKQT